MLQRQKSNNNQPKLYLVGTPIGNFDDMTFRAILTLKEVDLIYCEDTRITSKLLSHFDIHTPLKAYNVMTENDLTEGLINQIKNGKNVAVVTDAGLPGISDPVSLLNKELWIRFHMVWIGCLMAYTIGANNLSVIIQPFTMALTLPDFMIKGIICLFVGIGCLLVSRRVIKTISADLFPLNSVEALMMTLSAGLTLLLFSFGFSYLPAIPISSGAALIGAIVGISLAKGGYGLKVRPLIWVASSWMWVPFLSGLTCFAFVSMIQKWGVL